jgi:cell division protein FtsB
MGNDRKSGPVSRQEVVDRLLAQSEVLQQRSEELAAEVIRLKAELAKLDGHSPPERRKKPGMKGK